MNRSRRCWCCERHIYSLLFWNQNIGLNKNLIVGNQNLIIPKLKPFLIETERPVIYSFNNNWCGQEMHTVSEFSFILDRNKGPYMNKIPFKKMKGYEFSSIEDQKKYDFDQALFNQLNKYKPPNAFRRVIQKNLDYRDAQFINCNDFCMVQMQNYENQTTYVLPQYLTAGKYQYIIEYPKGKYFFHKAVIHYRNEPIPIKLLD